jgi:hypothetical protein
VFTQQSAHAALSEGDRIAIHFHFRYFQILGGIGLEKQADGVVRRLNISIDLLERVPADIFDNMDLTSLRIKKSILHPMNEGVFMPLHEGGGRIDDRDMALQSAFQRLSAGLSSVRREDAREGTQVREACLEKETIGRQHFKHNFLLSANR